MKTGLKIARFRLETGFETLKLKILLDACRVGFSSRIRLGMALSERRVDSVLSCELGSDRLEFETSLGSAPSARVGAVGLSRVRVEQRWIRVEKN